MEVLTIDPSRVARDRRRFDGSSPFFSKHSLSLMLRYLRIQHLAVIETLEVEFGPGLTVLTGETGAGKSVLVDAIGLLLGGRASSDVVRTGEALATVQAVFDTSNGQETIVRREVSAQGRSRAFVDDVLVTAAALKDLAPQLVDLHGQHEQQSLLNPETHLDVLDEFAGLHDDRVSLDVAFRDWQAARAQLERSQMDEREKSARLDLLSFQLNEIERPALKPGEDEALGTERRVLSNADKLARLCAEGYEALYEGEGAALSRLNLVWRRVADLATLDPAFNAYLADRDDLKSRLEELAFALREYCAGIDASPERLQQVEDRLALVERLKRKYGPALADVLERGASLRAEFEELRTSSARAADLERALALTSERYLDVAGRVSSLRRMAGDKLSAQLMRSLADLAMERARCEFRFGRGEATTSRTPEVNAWTARGYDTAELYLSANPGEELRPLARVASGGELSRIVLALKTIVTTDVAGKTLVFDEVDAGIGGRAADVVGRHLRALASRVQVLCVTHLPQIAAHAGTHLLVAKDVRGGRTITFITPLDRMARVEALAGMMSGTVTDAVRTSAEEMLRDRLGESENQSKGESESRPGETVAAGRQAKAKGKRVG